MRREKQKEFSTYKSLHLNREVKSVRRRNKGEEDHLFVWIGGKSNDRPFRKVLRAKYLQALEIELNQMRKQSPAEALHPQWADLARPEVERRVYDRLARHADELGALEESFERAHGRTMSPHEAALYASSVLQKDGEAGEGAEKGKGESKRPDPNARAETARRHWLQGIMKKVRHRNSTQPEKMQQAWAEAVGTENAMQTSLTFVQRQKGIAFARSLSSSVSMKISRDPDIRQKLSQALGCTITRIVFR